MWSTSWRALQPIALAVLLIACAGAPEPVSPVVDAAALEQSRQLFLEGNGLYDKGRLPEAKAAYLKAWTLNKSFEIAGNLGSVEADLRQWSAADEHLAYAVREFPPGGRPELLASVKRRLAEVETHVRDAAH